MVAKNPALLSRTASDIMARFSGQELSDMVEFYAAAYAGLSYAEALEEVLADAYAEMNAFEGTVLDSVVGNATRYTGVTRETAAATDRTTGPPAGEKFSIETLPGTSLQYVKADRQVITPGARPNQWAQEVQHYINSEIRQGRDIKVTAADGDVLTITSDTAGKAKFRNEITLPNGAKRNMTNAEFAAKLRAEAHIDELAQVSRRGKKVVPDAKQHSFAKDGFNYRTAYFEDVDEQYYRETISVGINGEIKTIYNVGRLDKTKAKPSLSAQRPDGNNAAVENLATNSIPTKNENVNGKKEKLSREVAEQEALSNNKTALKYFGQTHKWAETGYLLLDGKRLDFSGKHDGAPGGYRTVDHREISDALGLDYGGDSYSGAMVQFMSEGNIRIMPETNGINLSVAPTKAQEAALRDFTVKASGEVVLGIDNAVGDTVVSVEYPEGTSPSKVLSDIRQYFRDGTEPRISEGAGGNTPNWEAHFLRV